MTFHKKNHIIFLKQLIDCIIFPQNSTNYITIEYIYTHIYCYIKQSINYLQQIIYKTSSLICI